MVLNRVGDFGLTLGILKIYVKFNAVDDARVFTMAPFFST